MKVGIFPGTFDPVHSGHISFALATISKAKVDKVYFLLEKSPRNKPEVTPFRHRLAMLKLVAAGGKLDVLELSDRQFSVQKTLPVIQKLFPDDQMSLLLGADTAAGLSNWPSIDQLFEAMAIVVGLREEETSLGNLPELNNARITYINSHDRQIKSSQVRAGDLRVVPPKVRTYIKQNNLYDIAL
jgi:nicotinate-nucleotide adenylyltransferase